MDDAQISQLIVLFERYVVVQEKIAVAAIKTADAVYKTMEITTDKLKELETNE